MGEYEAWKTKYPGKSDAWIQDMMGKVKERTEDNSRGNQPPGGYPNPTGGTAKYGREMRDLQANRKALRRWILGIQ